MDPWTVRSIGRTLLPRPSGRSGTSLFVAELRRRLPPAVDRELLENPMHVVLDGRRLDAQSSRDLLVGEPLLDQAQHRELARAQMIGAHRRPATSAELSQQ